MSGEALTRDSLRVVWAAVLTPWTRNDRFDEPASRANVRALCEAGVHGLLHHREHRGVLRAGF